MSGKEKMNDEQSGAHTPSVETLTNRHLADAGTALGSDIQAKIGQHLRAMYDDVVRQGVPDRFLDLLAKLDRSEGKESGEGKGVSGDSGGGQ